MKSLDEIKEEFEQKSYSISDLTKSIIIFRILGFIFSELFLFIISSIPFIIGWLIISQTYGYSAQISLLYLLLHALFYIFYVKKLYNRDILPVLSEVKLIILALKQIKNQKINNNKK